MTAITVKNKVTGVTKIRKETFDNVSRAFDATRMIQDCAIDEFWTYIKQECSLSELFEVLDIGCGTGKVLLPSVLKTNFSVIGLDKSSEMLEIAQERILNNRSKLIGQINLLGGDALSLPFRSGYFDLIITTNVIHLVKEWEQFLREVNRCLLKKRKRFISAKVFTDVHTTEPFSIYWEKLAEMDQQRTYLAIADFSPHQEFMKNMGYKQKDFFYKEQVHVDPSIFIYILENRSYSSLWKVDYKKHIVAVDAVRNWFEDKQDLRKIKTTANVEVQYYSYFE